MSGMAGCPEAVVPLPLASRPEPQRRHRCATVGAAGQLVLLKRAGAPRRLPEPAASFQAATAELVGGRVGRCAWLVEQESSRINPLDRMSDACNWPQTAGALPGVEAPPAHVGIPTARWLRMQREAVSV